MSQRSRVLDLRPGMAIPGGRVVIRGEGFSTSGRSLPEVRFGDAPGRVVFASTRELAVVVPSGVSGRGVPVTVSRAEGDTLRLDIAGSFATGLHQVDSPIFDREGNLYVTYSGTRGQQVPVSIFRVTPLGARETFSSGIVNPTSLALDAAGRLHVSSRFEGTVYRLDADGSVEPFATELGVACGLAFAGDGRLFVGDRSGTIFAVSPEGRASQFATLPSSVAAFHLVFGARQQLYVTGPTLSAYDAVYEIDQTGTVKVRSQGFGRPQGLAMSPTGELFVAEALAGASGLYRVSERPDPELVLAGEGLVGAAIDADGTLVVCSNDTAFRLPPA